MARSTALRWPTLHMASELIDVPTYVERHLLAELREVAKVNAPTLLLTGIVQGMESLGALLDDKPLKARDQSKRRFRSALRRLFGPRYREVDDRIDLYGRLRNHLAHVRMPSGAIALTSRPDGHLTAQGEQLNLCPEVFLQDFERACSRLLELHGSGKVGAKRINCTIYS
jgi:hypothetical protein